MLAENSRREVHLPEKQKEEGPRKSLRVGVCYVYRKWGYRPAATKLLHGHFLVGQCHHDGDHLLLMGCLVIFH